MGSPNLALRIALHGKVPKRRFYKLKFTKRQLAKLPKSRQDAMEHGARYYFTGRPCRRGHLAPYYTKHHSCMECNRESGIMRYFKTTETATIIDPVAANTQEMPYRTIVL